MVLFLMFLAALNLVNRYFFCVYIAVAVFLLTPGRKVQLNSAVGSLLLFGLSMLIFDPASRDSILSPLKPFAFVLCYIMGYGVFHKQKDVGFAHIEGEKNVSVAVYTLAGGTMLHFLLNMLTNWGSASRSEIIDFWTQSFWGATGQATVACLTVGVSIALLFSKAGKLKKSIAVGALALIIAYNLILAGRTLFLLIIIVSVAAVLFVCKTEKRRGVKIVAVTLVAVAVLGFVYSIDLFGIKTAFESSNFYYRFFGGKYTQGLDEDSRMAYKLEYLKRFLDYPWGGEKIRSEFGEYAHDLYLDTYDEAGIFAFIAIIVYILSSLLRMVRCIRNKRFSQEIRLLVLCTYLICNIQFWVEPIMRGEPWLLAIYCFIDGAVTRLLQEDKQHMRLVNMIDGGY